MSNTNNIDRAIFASFEYRSRRNCLARLIKKINLAKTHYCRLSGSQSFCNATNTSYADPPKIQQHWSLSRENHCGAVLLLPGSRARVAS